MNQTFGLHIRSRREAGMASVHDLCLGTGIALNEIQNIEAGAVCATKEQVFRLANFFNCNARDFLRLNQVNRIALETTGCHTGQSVGQYRSAFFKNSPLATRRIENMQRELNSLESGAFNVKFHIPRPELSVYIESIVYCKGHNLGHLFEKVLPDGAAQLQIVIGHGGRERVNNNGHQIQSLNKAWVMGLNDIPVIYRLSDVKGIIYIRFKPGGLHAFTGIHQVELNNQVIDAQFIFGASIEILWEMLADCNKPAEMFLQVEDYFLKRLNRVVIKPVWVTYMLEHIDLPLTALAQKTGYSAKYLTKIFQKFVGIGPKNFQRIQRFNASLCYFNQLTDKVDWAYVAFENNYHDQAHFIKDFKHFSGFSPQNYLSLGASCARYLHC